MGYHQTKPVTMADGALRIPQACTQLSKQCQTDRLTQITLLYKKNTTFLIGKFIWIFTNALRQTFINAFTDFMQNILVMTD